MYREFVTNFHRVRPRRPYKNFGHFCLAHGSSFGNPYPCLACRGQGTIYDPNDPPCPIEGNKYRRTIRCAACGGSGKGTKEACRKAYQAAIYKYPQEKADYEGLSRLKRQALQRLTKDEIKALKELGL